MLISMLSMCGKEERNTMRQLQRDWFRQWGFLDLKFVLDENENGINCVEQLAAEQSKYNDLVFIPTKRQGYKQLIYKIESMVQFLGGELESGRYNYKYIFKTDDDSFIRPERLRKFVEDACGKFDECYFGALFKPSEGHSSPDYKARTLSDRFVFPFASGAGYGWSKSSLIKLNGMIKATGGLVKYEAEDATMGQWMSQIETTHFGEIHWTKGPSLCENPDTCLVHAIKKPNEMKKMMELEQAGKSYVEFCKTIRLNGP
ncbi:galactosyltransferase [Acrasis kona]|uniref:Hexosyltransferase n=1 Tax=Acrasis kona TaxID=1008807 RepID=A0AAW2ZCC1_9EUKA